MTAPATEAGFRRDHGCQTPGCPNDFAVVVVRVDSSETDMLCESCNLAFWLAVLQQAAEQGVISLDAPAPAGDGATHQQ